jgi:hypothetical protein
VQNDRKEVCHARLHENIISTFAENVALPLLCGYVQGNSAIPIRKGGSWEGKHADL